MARETVRAALPKVFTSVVKAHRAPTAPNVRNKRRDYPSTVKVRGELALLRNRYSAEASRLRSSYPCRAVERRSA